MHRVGVVVFRDRQRPDQIVEVTLVALAVRLEVGNFGQNRSTIDQAYEVSCLARGMRGHPVGAVIDQHIMLVETCALNRVPALL